MIYQLFSDVLVQIYTNERKQTIIHNKPFKSTIKLMRKYNNITVINLDPILIYSLAYITYQGHSYKYQY